VIFNSKWNLSGLKDSMLTGYFIGDRASKVKIETQILGIKLSFITP
jgi:hypothetical protein